MTPQSLQGALFGSGGWCQAESMPMEYWQMVWEVRQSTTFCGYAPLACPASFTMSAGNKTPLGGGEPTHVVQSADPPPAHPNSSKVTVTGRKLDLRSRSGQRPP